MIGCFGNRSLVTPLVSALPAFLAKTASCFNPIGIKASLKNTGLLSYSELFSTGGQAKNFNYFAASLPQFFFLHSDFWCRISDFGVQVSVFEFHF